MPTTAAVAAISTRSNETTRRKKKPPPVMLRRAPTQQLQGMPTSTHIDCAAATTQRSEAPQTTQTTETRRGVDRRISDEFPSLKNQGMRSRRVQPGETEDNSTPKARRGSIFTRSGGMTSFVDTVYYRKHLHQSSKKPWFIIDPRNSKRMERWDIATGVLAPPDRRIFDGGGAPLQRL